MNETVKDLIKSTLISIGMALTIFCLAGIVFDVGYGGRFSLEDLALGARYQRCNGSGDDDKLFHNDCY